MFDEFEGVTISWGLHRSNQFKMACSEAQNRRTWIKLPLATFLAILLAACSSPSLDIEEAQKLHAQVLAKDPIIDLRALPVVAELKIIDENTEKPLTEFIAVGSTTGLLADKFVGNEKVPLACMFLPLCYSEHDRSLRRVRGPLVATKATLVEPAASSR